LKNLIKENLENAFQKCRIEGVLKSNDMPDFSVEVPRNKEHGDLAANLAMILAKQEKMPPRQVAEALISNMIFDDTVIEKAEIAGPGFINFFFKQSVWQNVLKEIEEAGDSFGASEIGKGEKVMVEFVSANPTGPLHIGHGRGAALGDAVANILSFVGYNVEREYYVNDVGNQMQNLGKSVYLRYCQLLKKEVEFPDGLYKGSYIIDLAKELILKYGRKFLDSNDGEAIKFFTEFASDYILNGIKSDLKSFGVRFDNWFFEKQLFDSGEVHESIEHLKKKGVVYEKDGAVWFKSSEFGDEKDRVIIKDGGNMTYFASDIAYHRNKFSRGFMKVIDIWGADHHGYVPRIRSVLKALDIPQSSFEVLLVQIVSLLRDGQPVAMSTRSGEFVTLKEVIDEVGKDAARFIFMTRRSDAQLDFDLEVAKKQSDENPVYYVQYAHARICSIISFAGERGFNLPKSSAVNAGMLSAPEEIDLIKKLSQFTWIVAGSAQTYEPHRIAVYLLELVGQFHSYYNKHRVITEQQDLSMARLYLMNGIKRVLKNGLSLLGVSSPEKM
jgi:arginyl-tRNA synthetase